MIGGGDLPGHDHRDDRHRACCIAVVATSIVIVRRRLRYEWWYAVHLLAYAGIALAWFHQIPTGNELVLDRVAADYWRALYVATLALLVGLPARSCRSSNALRYRLRVAEVVAGGAGRRLAADHRAQARPAATRAPGQFFLWRFLARGRWWDGASVLALGGARRRGRCGSPSRRSATTRRRHRARSARARACSPRGRSASSPTRARRRDKVAADRRRHRHHADPRAARGDARRRRRRSTASSREEDVIFRGELEALAARARRRRRTTSSATTRATGASLLVPRPPARARARHRRARRLRVRAARDDRCPSARTSATQACRAATSTPSASPSDQKGDPMRKTLTVVLTARRARAARPRMRAAAAARQKATPKKKVVTKKSFTGPPARPTAGATCRSRSSSRRRRRPPGTKKTVKRTIIERQGAGLSATTPTARCSSAATRCRCSIQETLKAQSANIYMVSGATDTSDAFVQSLQAAITEGEGCA